MVTTLCYLIAFPSFFSFFLNFKAMCIIWLMKSWYSKPILAHYFKISYKYGHTLLRLIKGLCIHGRNVEFGNLIPMKFCFWKKIFAIFRINLSFRWIFLSFSYKHFWKFVKYSHCWWYFWPYSREFCILFSLGVMFMAFRHDLENWL